MTANWWRLLSEEMIMHKEFFFPQTKKPHSKSDCTSRKEEKKLRHITITQFLFHYPVSFENLKATEFFYIVRGKIRITLYNKRKQKVKDVIIKEGDIAYILEGHAMEILEDTTMFELKQGPYRGKEKDKEMI
jgi:hypothetical protein